MPSDYLGEVIFRNIVGAIVAPVSGFFGLEEGENGNPIDFFIMSPKKCYNSQLMRNHICLYLNYFERFYDIDKEYFVIMCQLKYVIDYEPAYRKEQFFYDLKRHILSPTILAKTSAMTNDNYSLELKYNNINNPALQYDDLHAKLLMQISILINLMIPLLSHFLYSKKIQETDDFLLEAFDLVFSSFNIEMDSKLFETSLTNVQKNEQSNKALWLKQDIRSKNVTTHSLSSLENIILNIIPKYVFNQNVINMNYSSIQFNANFQVTDIAYEFSYIPLSSSKRDEDNQSDFD